jgi:hypothetical protein
VFVPRKYYSERLIGAQARAAGQDDSLCPQQRVNAGVGECSAACCLRRGNGELKGGVERKLREGGRTAQGRDRGDRRRKEAGVMLEGCMGDARPHPP